MKKIILVISLALAVMTMSSCIVLRDIQDTDYTYTESEKNSKPNRPTGSDTSKNKPNRPGSSSSSKSTTKNKPNRP